MTINFSRVNRRFFVVLLFVWNTICINKKWEGKDVFGGNVEFNKIVLQWD